MRPAEQPTPSTSTPDTPYTQPVAYGPHGEPLYAHPAPPPPPPPPPQFVHISRAVEPLEPQVSPEVQRQHNESVAKYPFLNLSDQEFVIAAVRRHPIGLFIPLAVTLLLVFILAFLLGAYSALTSDIVLPNGGAFPDISVVTIPVILFMALILLAGYIACWVYLKNKFFLTNESVIQEIQTSLFSHDEQTVSLSNIEDVSYKQQGIIQIIFNYGSIRLSTEGDETTYRFTYVMNPKRQTALLNNAVEAFKNGRPIVND